MKVYVVAYGAYSDYREEYLTHEKKFSQKKFDKMYKKCLKHLTKKELKKGDESEYGIEARHVVKRMIKKYGFKKLKTDGFLRVAEYVKIKDDDEPPRDTSGDLLHQMIMDDFVFGRTNNNP